MPNAIPNVPTNPTINNPPVALTTGVVPRGDGFGQATDKFIFDLGQSVYAHAAMTTIVTGSPATISVNLEGSIDGNTWLVLATSTSTAGDTQFSVNPPTKQFTSLRVNVTATTGGTSPTIGFAISAFVGAP